MPVILKIIVVTGSLSLALFGSMLALTHFVEPEAREISITVPPSKFNR